MKILLQSIFLLCGFYFPANAQITLTPANNFEIGYQYVSGFNVEQGLSFDPGAEGENQVWDFSDVTSISSSSVTVEALENLPNAANYPNADSGFQDGNGSDSYFSNTNEAQSFWGASGSSGAVITYIDPQDYLRYPMTFQDEFVDEFSGTSTTNVTLERKGTTTVTIDGYGTIITPTGTYDDVVRVKAILDYGDFQGNFELAHYDETRYSWYNLTERSPLFSIVLADYGFSQTTVISYLESSTTLTKNKLALKPLQLYPNPANNYITVVHELKNFKDANVKIFNHLGQEVKHVQLQDNAINGAIDLSEIETGTYYLVIYEDNVVKGRERLIVVK